MKHAPICRNWLLAYATLKARSCQKGSSKAGCMFDAFPNAVHPGVAAYLRLAKAAVYAGLAGGVLLALAFFPSLVLCGLLVVAGVAALVWADHKGLLHREALRAVVGGIESMPDKGDRELVKRAVEGQADDRDRRTITKIKRADGFGSER